VGPVRQRLESIGRAAGPAHGSRVPTCSERRTQEVFEVINSFSGAGTAVTVEVEEEVEEDGADPAEEDPAEEDPAGDTDA
jgi:hypothetical protein